MQLTPSAPSINTLTSAWNITCFPTCALRHLSSHTPHSRHTGDCSKGDASLTVAARYDLNEGGRRQLTGAVDGKVVSAADVENMRVHAIAGPSTEVGCAQLVCLVYFNISKHVLRHGDACAYPSPGVHMTRRTREYRCSYTLLLS